METELLPTVYSYNILNLNVMIIYVNGVNVIFYVILLFPSYNIFFFARRYNVVFRKRTEKKEEPKFACKVEKNLFFLLPI